MQSLTIDNHSGKGFHDYTRNWVEPENFFSHELNQPKKFEFTIQDLADPEFEVPTRGSYVVFYDDRWEARDIQTPDSVVFTGYITDEPKPIFLGTNNGAEVWAYQCVAVSEDYLPQVKAMPAKTYVNKSRGYIIRDIVAEMFKNANPVPLDTTGVQDGGIERLFQTDRAKKFSDLLSDFGKADGYRYRVLHGKLFYEPEEEFLPGNSDPQLKLEIDPIDPRFTPSTLNLNRVATTICNDVTVFGEEEPTTMVTERFISDGYQGEHQLLFKPYGVTEKTLIDDDFTAPTFDTSIWQEEDDELALTGLGDGSYLQLFEGSFNIIGGSGSMAAPAEVYVRSRRGIELSGIIDFRDCEIFFPPSPSGTGIIGGLFPDETMVGNNVWCGWHVGFSGGAPQFQVLVNGAVIAGYQGDATLHYILRRRFEFDMPVGMPVIRRGPLGTDILFGDVTKVNGCWASFKVEAIDATDPQNVITTMYDLGRFRIENAPEFVLYASVVSYDLHAVMNFVKVWRPQQVRLSVNGAPVNLGDFIDGGVATVTVQDERAKLQWYSVPTSTPTPSDPIITVGTPLYMYKLGDTTATILDTGTNGVGFYMTADPGVSTIPGAVSSLDGAKSFPGSPHAIRGPALGGPQAFNSGFPVPFSFTAWVRTTAAEGAIFSYLGPGYGYCGFAIGNGRVQLVIEGKEYAITGNKAINDGNWHHVVATWDGASAGVTGNTKLYVDGVLDAEGVQMFNAPVIGGQMWAIGYANEFYFTTNTYVEKYMVGDIDEVGLYDFVLSPTLIDGIYKTSLEPPTAAPTPAYNPQTGVTIPPQGSVVVVTYYRAQDSKARVISETSIAQEQSKFGDDGIRQAIILKDEVFPTPRTSEECQYLAQAFLADRERPRYEGTYTFETGENDITRLDFFPEPGDMIPTNIILPNGEEILENLLCTNVNSQFIGAGAYQINLTFGPRSRFDQAQRKLLLARKSSLDSPEIKDSEVLIAEILNGPGYVVPPDPDDLYVANVTPLTFTVYMNATVVTPAGYGFPEEINSTLPEGVVGYEVRRDDTGWGQPNYVGRFMASSFTLNRGTRDKAYFIRPFSNQNVYSRNSALVRVISPLSNTLAVTGLDGDISPEYIRLFIPVQGNPDIGGFLVQKDNSDGVVLYQGDGIMHKAMITGANVLVESTKITLTIPNTIGAGSFTVRVLTYNLLGEYGPEVLFTITRAAETL